MLWYSFALAMSHYKFVIAKERKEAISTHLSHGKRR